VQLSHAAREALGFGPDEVVPPLSPLAALPSRRAVAIEHARRLEMVAEHTENSVLVTDRRGVIEWANAGFTRLTGFTSTRCVASSLAPCCRGPRPTRPSFG